MERQGCIQGAVNTLLVFAKDGGCFILRAVLYIPH
jgi:hypothetical protein